MQKFCVSVTYYCTSKHPSSQCQQALFPLVCISESQSSKLGFAGQLFLSLPKFPTYLKSVTGRQVSGAQPGTRGFPVSSSSRLLGLPSKCKPGPTEGSRACGTWVQARYYFHCLVLAKASPTQGLGWELHLLMEEARLVFLPMPYLCPASHRPSE